MLTLRPYQQSAVDGIRQSFLNGSKSPLLVLPTGGGKTIVFSYIAATTAARGKRVLILVHRIELLRQTSEKLHMAGVDHGLINAKYSPNYYKPVQVASVQTLIKRLHKIAAPDLIIVDEAHHAVAGTWSEIIKYFPNAYVLGVTATPVRGDGTGLGKDQGGIFDDLIMGPQIGELIDMGFLVKPKVFAPQERLDTSVFRTKMGDYDKHQVAEVMDKPTITGNAVQHYMKACAGEPAVVFCVTVKHAEHVAEQFRLAGFRAYSVDGSMEDDVRKRILNGLGNGTVDVVCSCDIISEGTDIPAISAAILLRPTKSLGLFIQQVGRALRTAPNKSRAVILDHVGNTLLHGMPEWDRDWTLDGAEKNKRGKSEEPTIRVDQCEKCFAMYAPAPQCPHCGFVKEVKDNAPQHVDGDLVEVTKEQAELLKRAKRKEVAQANTREALERIARERGYKPGWVNRMLQEKDAARAKRAMLDAMDRNVKES